MIKGVHTATTTTYINTWIGEWFTLIEGWCLPACFYVGDEGDFEKLEGRQAQGQSKWNVRTDVQAGVSISHEANFCSLMFHEVVEELSSCERPATVST